jgi:hypothetical protein
MEAHPGVFTSDLDAQDWEPLDEVPVRVPRAGGVG